MRRILLAATVLFASLGTTAQAATIGSTYDVDPALGVNGLSSETSLGGGYFNSHSHKYADLYALGNNWGALFDGDTSSRRLTFNEKGGQPSVGSPNSYLEAVFANTIYNISGYDILLFDSGDAPSTSNPADPANTESEMVSVSRTGNPGTWFDMLIIDFLSSAEVGGPDETYGVYVLALDLSVLGVNEGEGIDSLWFGNSASLNDWDPDIVWGGGVTGADSPAVVPVPAAMPLLLTGLAGLGLMGWRKRRKPA